MEIQLALVVLLLAVVVMSIALLLKGRAVLELSVAGRQVVLVTALVAKRRVHLNRKGHGI